MDKQEFYFIPAFGGAWLGLSHTPNRNLERTICLRRDARLGRMSWKGGLCMIRAIVKDARGGQRLPDIDLIHGPSRLKVKVLGTRITVASPPVIIFKDGFYAARSDGLVNGLRHLRTVWKRSTSIWISTPGLAKKASCG